MRDSFSDPDPLGLIDAFLGSPAADAVEPTYLAWLVTLAPALDPANAAALLLARPATGPRTVAGERLLGLLRDTTRWSRPGGGSLHRGPAPACGATMSTKIPATIVTGFLGAGKTSLVRHLIENAERQAPGAADQRVRRSRRRPRAPRRLRDRSLPRGGRDRARQRLHLLHRGRRLPAGDAHDPGPRPGAGPHRDRDLGPGAAQAAGGRLQLAGGAQPADRRRRAGGRRRRRGAAPAGSPTIPTRSRPSAPPTLRSTTRPRSRSCSRSSSAAATSCWSTRPIRSPTASGRRSRPAIRAELRPGVRLVWTSHGRIDPAVALGLGVGRRDRPRQPALAP